jgi:predicted N-formylglutamate amidohydrolase
MDRPLEGENFVVRRRDGRLVLTCEHASRAVPADVALGVDEALLDAHWGWDRWVLDVLERVAPPLDATSIASRVSRLVVDVNRDPADATLCVPRVEGRPVPGNCELAPAARAARVARFHAPYHAAIDAELARLVRRHGAEGLLLVSLHSFTGEWTGQDRDFDVGVLFDAHEPLARRVRDAFAAQGLRARLNEPYSGLAGLIYAAKRHGDAHGVRYVELELNQHVLERAAARERLAVAVEAVLREVVP